MGSIVKTGRGWELASSGLRLVLDAGTGEIKETAITAKGTFLWTRRPCEIRVRDDLAGRVFGPGELRRVAYEQRGETLEVSKSYRNAPWMLTERYSVEEDVLAWTAEVALEEGDFRSLAVSMRIPWPKPVWRMKFWAARENMPSAPQRFSGISLEYGEITGGILMPALCAYREDVDAGMLMTVPFDFRTPRFSFNSDFREHSLEARFDWLALAPGRPARASMLLHGTGGHWRPALGWIYRRYKEYFEPRSALIGKLWGGHISGGFNVRREDARRMSELGMKWHEIHGHFPVYGDYHPEGRDRWLSGHIKTDRTPISAGMLHRTIKNLHGENIAAFPYIQVTGDGDEKLLPRDFYGSSVSDLHGERICAWPGTRIMNSDPSLPFGRDITRQIKGMVERYPEMDGVFLDQACYNFLDTAHDDGLTAVANRPAYMTGFNYFPHLELLSSLLHPRKAIIANGAFGIGIMKYIDGFMAEGSGWLCDHFQYYGLSKPMYFLMREEKDRDVELMFQRCLLYGAGFSSYPGASASRDLYDIYLPLLKKLFRRRWVFEADPISLPSGFLGNLYELPSGSLAAGIVSCEPRVPGRKLPGETVYVRSARADEAEKVTLHTPGSPAVSVNFARENGGVVFDLPGSAAAAVAELKIAA